MTDRLDELILGIRRKLRLQVIVLFQHPSPTDVNSISIAGRTCMNLMRKGYIEKICVVYDVEPGRNCWSYDSIKLALTGMMGETNNLIVGEPVVIGRKNQDTYRHPIFGKVTRSGWALMKKADEVSFNIELS